MTLVISAGTKLGPYEIVGALGAGGMGEVYRARDTRLNRDVAIKLLLPAVAGDPDRLARFSREAQVLASLNHSNIAQIYGLDRLDGQDGSAFIVMELVEGEELAQRVARGPLPPAEALPIAKQIADALEAAHEQGIIHRDLKPANVKVRPDGTVKVLDFGLAKAVDPAGGSSVSAMNSPTLSIHATEAGLILGTAAYMSPEQARGAAVDRRADIWAFGGVLFEMLTGRRAFEGGTTSDVMASVLKSEPPWSALAPDVPPAIRRLLRRCLEKDVRRRLQSIGDARLQIEDVIAGVAEDAAPVPSSTAPAWRHRVPWAVAVVALLIAGALGWRLAAGRRAATPFYGVLDAPANHVLGEDDSLTSLPTRPPIVFTPDGGALIIQAARANRPQLFLRSLDNPEIRPIPGTDQARAPFVSPDGKWIGFWSENEIRKIPVEGGTATTICALPAALGPYGAAWGPGDVIVFGDDASGRIMRVSAGGGAPVPVTAQPPPRIRRHVAPSFLPDGRRILYTDVSVQDATDTRIMVQALDGGDARVVVSQATDGRLLPSGHLAFMRVGTLMTVAMDPVRAEITGDAVAAMPGVMQSGLRARVGALNTGAGMFAVSSQGTLAAIRGPMTGVNQSRLVWVTRDGQESSAEPKTGAPKGGQILTRISPDGSRAVVSVGTPMRREMWLADWSRDLWTICSDCNSESGLGTWSPDGRRLLVGRNDTLVAHALDGSSPDQIMVKEPGHVLQPMNWLLDGRIVYNATTESDLGRFETKMLEPGGRDGRVILPLGSARDIDVSADGRWLAYTTSEYGVVVQAFPGPGSRLQVSASGAQNPKWSTDGKTLYYLLRGQGIVAAVDVTTTPGLSAGRQKELFRYPDLQTCANSRCYDVAADGRFLFRDRHSFPRTSVTRMDLVLNWTATLKK